MPNTLFSPDSGLLDSSPQTPRAMLDKHVKYVHIAFNNTLEEATRIIGQLPQSSRIMLEAGTPLIKQYGIQAITTIKDLRPSTYVIADMKCADLALKEVAIAREANADAVTAVGTAPIATLDAFTALCAKHNMDSIIDMMNIQNPLLILKKLTTQPTIVMIHRGADETEYNKEKVLPFYQIKQIKGNYNDILIDIGGGDTLRDIQSAVFNEANIVMLWKAFYGTHDNVTQLINDFLSVIQ